MEKYYQKDIECASPETIKGWQNEKIVSQVRNVWDNVPYYRALMEEKGVCPDDIKSIDDISKLPFISKADLREAYPFGLLARPLSECVRIHSTSGTTGKRVIAFYTEHDLALWDDICARAIVAAGGTRDDIVQVCYGYGLFTGGLGLHYGTEYLGAITLPVSSGNTKRQIQLMQDFGSNILACTPSYALYIGETLREAGVDPKKLPLRAGIFGAEPWTENMRKEIERMLDIKAYDIYGLSEIAGPGVAFDCECQCGLHINEDFFYPEIIDPETGKVLPDGEVGELVFTCIGKEALPLIRYRTRDIASLTHEKCACGRTLVRMTKPKGRSDDMLIIRGINVFPSQVEHVLTELGLIPNYQIVVDRKNNLDIMEVKVELADRAGFDTVKELEAYAKTIENALQSTLNIHAKVTLVEPMSLPRSEGKAKRVIDNRNII